MGERGYYHCDMKPKNIMVNAKSFKIKIIDFEDFYYDKSKNPLLTDQDVGTIGYMSPEACTEGTLDLKQSLVFSIGCILYSCIEKKLPFKSESDTIECKPLEMTTSSLSASLFIKKCTERDPWKRVRFSELLRDKWFNFRSSLSSNRRCMNTNNNKYTNKICNDITKGSFMRC